MPIRAENRALYPANWKRISLEIRRDRAKWRCEMIEGGARCEATQGEPHPITRSTVVLTVMHLDHDPTHNADGNLLAACQRCHNRYDAPMRRRGIQERAREALNTPDLLEGREG